MLALCLMLECLMLEFLMPNARIQYRNAIRMMQCLSTEL